jgi:hypothetical protein
MNLGKRTQVIWWWRWGCWGDWTLGWRFGLWPNQHLLVGGRPWKLFRYYHFGAFEIRRWLEDMNGS